MSRRYGPHLHHGAVDVRGAHDLVVRDQLVLVHGSEDVAAGDGLINTRHGTHTDHRKSSESNQPVFHQKKERGTEAKEDIRSASG